MEWNGMDGMEWHGMAKAQGTEREGWIGEDQVAIGRSYTLSAPSNTRTHCTVPDN